MVAYLSTTGSVNSRPHRVRSTPPGSAGADLDRYRLHVVALDVTAAVSAVGGLIFDRTMAGWDVVVLVAGEVDDRPIKILGATVEELATALRAPRNPCRPPALAVATQLVINSERVRRHVIAALDDGTVDIVLWGGRCPTGLRRGFAPVRHRPSAAARVFKGYALAAAGASAPDVDMADEGFFSPR